MLKPYCYVDETGQHTEGKLFLVSVVIMDGDQQLVKDKLESIEQATKKGRLKWIHNRDKVQYNYMNQVLTSPECRGALNYSSYTGTKEYDVKLILTTPKALLATIEPGTDYKATYLRRRSF